MNSWKRSCVVLVRTERHAKLRRIYIKIPNGWDSKNDRDGKKDENDYQTQGQCPVNRKQGTSQRPSTSKIVDIDIVSDSTLTQYRPCTSSRAILRVGRPRYDFAAKSRAGVTERKHDRWYRTGSWSSRRRKRTPRKSTGQAGCGLD